MAPSMPPQSGGWSLSNPMTPQGMMSPMGVAPQMTPMGGPPQSSLLQPNNMIQPTQNTNAKKLTSADIDSLLG